MGEASDRSTREFREWTPRECYEYMGRAFAEDADPDRSDLKISVFSDEEFFLEIGLCRALVWLAMKHRGDSLPIALDHLDKWGEPVRHSTDETGEWTTIEGRYPTIHHAVVIECLKAAGWPVPR